MDEGEVFRDAAEAFPGLLDGALVEVEGVEVAAFEFLEDLRAMACPTEGQVDVDAVFMDVEGLDGGF